MPTEYIYAFLIGYTFAIGWVNLLVGFSGFKTRAYLYFGLLSLFASVFLFAQTSIFDNSEIPNLRGYISIVTASCFYILFLWFIGEYTGFKRKLVKIIIPVLIGVVVVAYFLPRASGIYITAMRVLAHGAILAISIYGIIGGIRMKIQHYSAWNYIFLLLMCILAILTILVGIKSVFNIEIVPDPPGFISPLDFFPIGFSIIIGSKMSHDIVRSYRLERELKQKDRQWGHLVEAIAVLMVELDPAGNIVWVNSHFRDFTGYSSKEIIGKNWFSTMLEQDEPIDREKANNQFIVGGNQAFQNDISVKGGKLKSIQWSNISLKNTEGVVTGVLNIGTDVSEREETLMEVKRLKDQIEKENLLLKEKVKWQEYSREIIGKSDALHYVIQRANQVSNTNSTVLLEGETGVGKELFAKLIHQNSLRRHKPLIKVNCASLPKDLIESELFGHEKGAFTGAISSRQGRFELADKGTLFLDEIGELPLDLQPKLLRVLQSGEFERIGSEKTTKVDVRMISATNRDLQLESEKGLFRQDLFFRLNVYPITIPPLRQRAEDIPLLVRHFAEKIGKRIGKRIKHISKADMQLLQSYAWPGNVRELENIIERAIINSTGDNLAIDRKQLKLSKQKTQVAHHDSNLSLAENEKHHIINILEACNWKINGENGAAEKLGMPPSTLRSKMKKLGIVRR